MAIVDTVAEIAQGSLGNAAKKVEGALAKAIPVTIGFLASLLGLGDISETIKSIIAKIQAPVHAAVKWVITKAVALVKAAGKLLGLGKKDKSASDTSPEEAQRRLDLGVSAAVKAVDRLAGRAITRAILTPVLAAIRIRYRLTSLEPYQDVGFWAVRGTINPTKEQRTARRAELKKAREGVTVGGVNYYPEANLLGSGKHGLDWTEGRSRAKDSGNPQGQFGSIADVNFAVERASELGPNKNGTFPLPPGHTCRVYKVDGTVEAATEVFVKVYEDGKVHAYPK